MAVNQKEKLEVGMMVTSIWLSPAPYMVVQQIDENFMLINIDEYISHAKCYWFNHNNDKKTEWFRVDQLVIETEIG